MSWESVRDLGHMKEIILIIRNIAAHVEAPGDIMDFVHSVLGNLEEVFEAMDEGEIV
jgi:hypothetical protein